jgi:ribose-phosphate pyrophosphokinase
MERIENSCLDELIVADTIPVKDGACSKITVLSIAELFAEAIKRIHTNDSVSSLFI